MRAHRVVATRRSGRHVFYRLNDSHVRMLLDLAITHVGHSPVIGVAPTNEPESPVHPVN